MDGSSGQSNRFKEWTKITGLMALITDLASMHSSIIEGYLWMDFSPDAMLISSFIAGITFGIILYFFVKEPEVKER